MKLTSFAVVAAFPISDAGEAGAGVLKVSPASRKQPHVEVDIGGVGTIGIATLQRICTDPPDLVPIAGQEPGHHQVADADAFNRSVAELPTCRERRLALLN